MNKPLMRLSLLVRKIPWKIDIKKWLKTEGWCHFDLHKIELPVNCKDRLASATHELLHACFPDINEDAIVEAEKTIVAGLRLLKKKKYLEGEL